MSTRSAIIMQNQDGTHTGIYCHSDGYLEGVGHTLRDHYRDPAKVAALVALGDLSSLHAEVAPAPGVAHSYEARAPGVTTAYHRDRGEDWNDVSPRHAATAKEVAEQIENNGYVYVFSGGRWHCNGEPIPVTEKE